MTDLANAGMAILVAVMLAPTRCADAKPIPVACPEGRYLVEAAEPAIPLAAVALAGGAIRLEGACGIGLGHLAAAQAGRRLHGRLPRCVRVGSRVGVRGVISADCETIEGVLRRERGTPHRQPFRATRSRCGDGRIDRGAGEQCDRGSGCIPGLACAESCTCRLPEVTGSSVAPATTTTTSLRGALCGNDVREPGEVCDGPDLGSARCEDGGELTCLADCLGFDRHACFACGNGSREGDEECDVHDLGDARCDAPGETGGRPSCTPDCRIDHESCHRCGNGTLDPGEWCDDGNTLPLDGCGAHCESECGNGSLEPNEECDDGNATLDDGCIFCLLEEVYTGGGDDPVECGVLWGMAGPPPPAPTVTCADGDPRCDVGVTGGCLFRVFSCFNRPEILVVGAPPPCTWTNVARVQLTGESLSGPRALEEATQDVLLSAMAAALARRGSTVARNGAGLKASPAVSASPACAEFLLPVPPADERVVATQVTDSAGVTDDDAITFRCEP